MEDSIKEGLFKGKTLAQAASAIVEATALAGRFASHAAVQRLRYHSIRCAIHYAPLQPYKDSDGSKILDGEVLRQWLLLRWRRMERLPTNCLRQMFSDWINPKANEFLCQGGFRRRSTHNKVLYFHRLAVAEASYLIQRFEKIQDTLEKGAQLQDSTDNSIFINHSGE